MNVSDHYLICANRAALDGFEGLSGAILDLYRGEQQGAVKRPESPQSVQRQRQAVKNSFDPWGANE